MFFSLPSINKKNPLKVKFVDLSILYFESFVYTHTKYILYIIYKASKLHLDPYVLKMEEPVGRLKKIVEKANAFEVDHKISAVKYLRSSKEMERMVYIYIYVFLFS